MSLSSLPTELKLHIINDLEPKELLPFALSSKEHLKLCDEHLKMFARYHTIQCNPNGQSLWTFTRDILQNPRGSWYVRELHLIQDEERLPPGTSEDDETRFDIVARQILPLYSYEPGFFAAEPPTPRSTLEQLLTTPGCWYQEHATLVLLLHHLPQLRRLKMVTGFDNAVMLGFMRCVAAGYQNPARAPQMPLQHLQTVSIAHYDTEDYCDVEWAVYFMCVPSLRTFAGCMMGSEDVGQFYTGQEGTEDDPGTELFLRNTAAAPVSNVEELIFSSCQLDPQSLNTLLPMTKNLKSFCYTAAGMHVAYEYFDARKVILALVNHAKDSLEELRLMDDEGAEMGEDEIEWAPAHSLQKLKALHCEARWLCSLTGDWYLDGEKLVEYHCEDIEDFLVEDPRNNLPGSLEYLYLDGFYSSSEWQQMCHMFAKGNAKTPKLDLDNTRIVRNGDWDEIEGEERMFGCAIEPNLKFAKPHLKGLWTGITEHLRF